MQTSIPFTMSDVRQKAGLLLAYTSMQAQQFTDAADAVHIILGRRRWRRAQGRRMLLVRPWLKEARRFQHGHFHRLMPELRYEDPSSYFNYLALFDELQRTSSTRHQRSANAAKAHCLHCERRESAVIAS